MWKHLITMKTRLLLLIIVIFLAPIWSNAQDISGSWNGVLKVQTQELPIVFHITETDGLYSSAMDSPSQGAMGIKTNGTTFKDSILEIDMSNFGIQYKGYYDGTLIKGTFSQGTMPIALDLTKGNYEAKAKKQEPIKPYPYNSEEITFTNYEAQSINLSGTLTLPKDVKNPPVVILISGSGPQNRDAEILGHKPFLVISDHLTRNGFAVLRYDDRGTSNSEGIYKDATSFDFASDVEAAISYLKTRADVIDTEKIGLIGHSEGGLIAPMIASKSKDVTLCVLLAGPGVSGKEILLTQTRRAMELGGVSKEDIEINEKFSLKIYDICMNYKGEESKKEILANFEEMKNNSSETFKAQLTDGMIQQQLDLITSPWMRKFITIEPKDYLMKTSCPVLALIGEKDFQVEPTANLSAIEEALKVAKNDDVETREMKDLNHLFQTSVTGSFTEYASNEETFSPIALEYIVNWLKIYFIN